MPLSTSFSQNYRVKTRDFYHNQQHEGIKPRTHLKALALVRKSAFRPEMLPGTGETQWRKLWNAAAEFSSVAYPGANFPVRLQITSQLNQLLADTMTLRDLYKKCHWQVAGPTFYQLHLLFDKHYDEQNELVDAIAERIQLLGGISLAMAADVAETTQIERPPRGREEIPVQLSRLVDAHQIIIEQARPLARRASELGDDGTNDLVVSDVIRTNELQIWFLSEHLVDVPLVEAKERAAAAGAT